MSNVGIHGERSSGMDVRINNSINLSTFCSYVFLAMAVTAIANIVKSSLGP